MPYDNDPRTALGYWRQYRHPADAVSSRDCLYQAARRSIDTGDGRQPLLTFVPHYVLPPFSLLELTDGAAFGAWDSALDDVGEVSACTTPLRDLTCAQARMLAARRMGMRWLAEPIASFVTRYPSAQCGLFDGDMSLNAILGWRALARFAPQKTQQMLRSDFAAILGGSLTREPSSIIRKAHIELARARAFFINMGEIV